MDYEKKYKNALEWARQVMNGETGFIRKEVEEIFPELAENEDEKIRNVLVELVKGNERCGHFMINNITTSSMLAWLEKKGEQEYHCTGVGEPKESTGALKQLIDEEKSWNEEDERMCNDIIRDITIDKSMCKYEVSIAICDEQIAWLKQLKYRIGG